MKRIISLVILAVVFAAASSAQVLDQFGGDTALKCQKATGWFHTEKIGKRWWLCTPAGNSYWLAGTTVVILGSDQLYVSTRPSKYGSAEAWQSATVARLRSWDFNTVGDFSHTALTPVFNDRVHIPFTAQARPALYSMRNPVIDTPEGSHRLIANAVKNIMLGRSPFYDGYVYPDVADYFDMQFKTFVRNELTEDSYFVKIRKSAKQNWTIGITADDSDDLPGFGAGPDFPTDPPDRNGLDLALLVATMSPVQTANSMYQWVYPDTVVHSKVVWRDYLAGKYKTIAALNAAWKSNYSTFDSSGTAITGEAISGEAALTYRHKVAQVTPSRCSLQVLLKGSAIAGDTCDGKIFGPDVTGTIDYKSGELTLAFKTPPNGALTINYVQNGWGIGTGLLDEDRRPSHQASFGASWRGASNANLVADLKEFLFQLASQYFKTCRDEAKAVFPNLLFLGPDTLTTWGVPSAEPVMRAAGLYLDAFIAGGSPRFSPKMMDFIAQSWGDKPYIATAYRTANPDSDLSAYKDDGRFSTQRARGEGYAEDVNGALAAAVSSTGTHPFIGMLWWQYMDNWGEKLNWGLVTLLDNAYDGHEAVKASVPCSAPLEKFACGGESRDYGDAISSVKRANAAWHQFAKDNN